MKAGDLIQFKYIYSGCELNNRKALFLGKDQLIIRGDGVEILNYSILLLGETKPICIDRSLLKHMEKITNG